MSTDSLAERSRHSKMYDAFTPKGKVMRSKKLDNSKPLPIYFERDMSIEDLDSSMLRPLASIATGVDKEEEGEEHLKQILTTGATTSASGVHIPIPETNDRVVSYYNELYPPGYQLPKIYYKAPPASRWQSQLFFIMSQSRVTGIGATNLIGYQFGAKSPLNVVIDHAYDFKSNSKSIHGSSSNSTKGIFYNCTEKDVAWVQKINKDKLSPLNELSLALFEKIIFILESLVIIHGKEIISSGFLSLNQAKPFIEKLISNEELSLLKQIEMDIFNYWTEKRKSLNDIPLSSTLKIEDIPTVTMIDPYVCFRRREIRPVRKTRRSDALSIEKFRHVRSHFSETLSMLEAILSRDCIKQRSFAYEQESFVRSLKLELWVKRFHIILQSKSISDDSTILRIKTPKIRTILPSDESGLETDKISDRRSMSGVSFEAKLFGLKDSYKLLKRVYYRSKFTDDLLLEGSNKMNTFKNSSWAKFFKPFEVISRIEKSLSSQQLVKKNKTYDFDFLSSNIFHDANNKTNADQFYYSSDYKTLNRNRIGRGGRIILDNRRNYPQTKKQFEPDERFIPSSHLKGKPLNKLFKCPPSPNHPSLTELPLLNTLTNNDLNAFYMNKTRGHCAISGNNLLGNWGVTRSSFGSKSKGVHIEETSSQTLSQTSSPLKHKNLALFTDPPSLLSATLSAHLPTSEAFPKPRKRKNSISQDLSDATATTIVTKKAKKSKKAEKEEWKINHAREILTPILKAPPPLPSSSSSSSAFQTKPPVSASEPSVGPGSASMPLGLSAPAMKSISSQVPPEEPRPQVKFKARARSGGLPFNSLTPLSSLPPLYHPSSPPTNADKPITSSSGNHSRSASPFSSHPFE